MSTCESEKKPTTINLIDNGELAVTDINRLAALCKNSFFDGQFYTSDSAAPNTNHNNSSSNSSRTSTPLYTPHTGEIYGQIDNLTEKEINHIVDLSKQAFENWRYSSAQTRANIFNSVASILQQNVDLIASLEVFDTGKTITETRGDVLGSIECLQYFAAQCHNINGTHHRVSDSAYVYTVKEPLGVCLGIGAWNFPIMNILWKAAPALASGNCMVYKPSEVTPLTSTLIAYLFSICGLPKNVLNIIQGNGTSGSVLCSHPKISKVSFTGGYKTGQLVSKTCVNTFKRVTLELGGKSPLIVFDDADIDCAVHGAMMANYYTQGQVCSNAARIYIHETVYQEFKEKLVSLSQKIRVGNPNDEKTHFGAMISKQHLAKVQEILKKAKEDGATVVYESPSLDLEQQNKNGYFMGPVILEGCADGLDIVKNEIFGPIITLHKFSQEHDVIMRANNTPYGLAAGVFSKDIGRITRICSMFDASTIYANCYNVYPPFMSFGGRKYSGNGRENGSSAVDYYTDLKSVYVETNNIDCPFSL